MPVFSRDRSCLLMTCISGLVDLGVSTMNDFLCLASQSIGVRPVGICVFVLNLIAKEFMERNGFCSHHFEALLECLPMHCASVFGKIWSLGDCRCVGHLFFDIEDMIPSFALYMNTIY